MISLSLISFSYSRPNNLGLKWTTYGFREVRPKIISWSVIILSDYKIVLFKDQILSAHLKESFEIW